MPLSAWRLFGEGLRTTICCTDGSHSWFFNDFSLWWGRTASFPLCRTSVTDDSINLSQLLSSAGNYFSLSEDKRLFTNQNPTITQENLKKMLVYNLFQWKQSCHSDYANDPYSVHCVHYWFLCHCPCMLQTQAAFWADKGLPAHARAPHTWVLWCVNASSGNLGVVMKSDSIA